MKVSDKYLSLVDKFIFMGTSLKHIAMNEEQKLRTMIAYEAYQVWMTNKQIRPMELCRRISARIYSDMLMRAEHDPHYSDLCNQLKIEKGKQRDYSRLANDVQTLDHIIGLFNAPTANIEKAKVIDASDWLIEEGMKNGNDRAVKNGVDIKMKLHRDFDEREQGYDNIANTDINITGDVSVVKPDRQNYTEEQKRAFAKRFGLPEREVEELIRNADGVYETAPMEQEKEFDIFDERNGK
jgi:hypothetical protein